MNTILAVLSAVAVYVGIAPSPSRRVQRVARRSVPHWAEPVRGAPVRSVRVGVGVLTGALVFLVAELPMWISSVVAVVVGAGAMIGAGKLETTSYRRRIEQRIATLPDVLTLLAGALEAGVPLRRATAEVADAITGVCAADLTLVSSRVAVGVSDARAWAELADEPGWHEIATDVSRAVNSGEGVAQMLRVHAEQMRRHACEQVEKKARKAGVDAIIPLAVCHLPAFILVGVVPIIAGTILKVT